MRHKLLTEKEEKGYEEVEDAELGENFSTYISALGLWSRRDLVPLGGGQKDFENFSHDGSQYWFAGGEDLATEGTVLDLLVSMAPSFRKLGLILDVHHAPSEMAEGKQSYKISINGADLTLFEVDPSSPRLALQVDPRRDPVRKPLARVNELLREVGTIYRIGFFERDGNSGIAVLLPEDLLRRFASSDLTEAETFVIP
jgi:hypothetical protein